MVARRLYVTLQQVIRSVLIILFPLAFITLFAWATAGSTYGTTSDPMRAAVDRKSTRLNSSHVSESRMPSSA